VREPATSCSSCGKLLAAEAVLYSSKGDISCQTCVTAAEVAAGHDRSAEMARNLAYGNVVLGLASFFFNPFFLLSMGAIGNGVYVFRRLSSDARRGETVPDGTRRRIASAIGMGLGLIGFLASLLRAGL